MVQEMMNTSFVLSYFIMLVLFWLIFATVEWYLNKRKKAKYARNHFELTERFRNGLQ